MKRQEKGERPKCPECGAENPWSVGGFWKCTKCNYQWTKVKRCRKSQVFSGPPCVECGSKKVVSSGSVQWRCTVCERRFMKNPRRKEASEDFGDILVKQFQTGRIKDV